MTELEALKERLNKASRDPRLLMLPDVRAALGELVPVLSEIEQLRRDVRTLASATEQMHGVAGAISHVLWRSGVSGRDPIAFGLSDETLNGLRWLGATHAKND